MADMKLSDKKKYEKAWLSYYEENANLALALTAIHELPDKELRIDEINQIASSVGKLAKSIRRVCESHQLHVDDTF